MPTNIEIPDDLLRQVKAQAAREGVDLRDLIERGLRLVTTEPGQGGRRRLSFPLLHSSRPGALTAEAVRTAEEEMAQFEDAARAGSP